mmetsp:Transcript_38380/g.109693  ORF Transcript_38380/g.109693 Transcript_38380/m.109693 type:complete len:102 (-) Transcript_38380:70-375(-)
MTDANGFWQLGSAFHVSGSQGRAGEDGESMSMRCFLAGGPATSSVHDVDASISRSRTITGSGAAELSHLQREIFKEWKAQQQQGTNRRQFRWSSGCLWIFG